MKTLMQMVSIFSGLLVLSSGLAFAQELTIGNYILLDSTRVDRTLYEYTYTAEIINAGPAVQNVTATLASISPNTTVIDGELDFGDIESDATVTSRDTFTIRQNRRYPINWSDLTWDIDYTTQVSYTGQVTPDGGLFEFPNGVTLDIPPGAVAEEVEIEITDIICQQVDDILLAHQYETHEIRCLGGFMGKPDGMEFLLPVTATVPVSELKPGEIPIQLEVDLDAKEYRLAPTNFRYRGEEGLAQIEIQGFSPDVAAALSTDEATEWSAPLPPCCSQSPRPKKCCCSTFFSQSDHSELASSAAGIDCIMAAAAYQTIATLCPDQPEQLSWAQEISEDCPEMTCNIEIEPAVLNLFVCEEKDLDASITCETTDGSPVPLNNAKFEPFWRSYNEAAATVDPRNGMVTGKNAGTSRIKAAWAVPLPNITPGWADVTVESNISSFSIMPSTSRIMIGDAARLEAEVIGSDGEPLNASTVIWSSSGTAGYLTRDAGEWTTFEARERGTDSITAKYTYDSPVKKDCQAVSATAVVTVDCVALELSVTEAILAVEGFLSVAVSAVSPSGEPYEISEAELTWASSAPNIAAVIPSVGSYVTIVGISEGIATITVSYNQEGCGRIEATVLITVEGGIAGAWHLSPLPNEQFEECRDSVVSDWYEEDEFSDFDVMIYQSISEEEEKPIEANYIPDTGTTLTGTWNSISGEFNLAIDSSNIAECGYLFSWDGGEDLCGDAIDCQLESCHITTNILGVKWPDINDLEAESNWYYSVTISYDDLIGRGKTTYECRGTANLQGTRLE